jgi:hypothetical protein
MCCNQADKAFCRENPRRRKMTKTHLIAFMAFLLSAVQAANAITTAAANRFGMGEKI